MVALPADNIEAPAVSRLLPQFQCADGGGGAGGCSGLARPLAVDGFGAGGPVTGRLPSTPTVDAPFTVDRAAMVRIVKSLKICNIFAVWQRN